MTFGGKYDSERTPPIEASFSSPIPTIEPPGDWIDDDFDKEFDGLISTSYNIPAGTVYGPIWGLEGGYEGTRSPYWIRLIEISNNTYDTALTGIQQQDQGAIYKYVEDEDGNLDQVLLPPNDLAVFPTDQDTINGPLYSPFSPNFASGSVLAPDPPSQSTVRGVGGNTGMAIKKIGTTSYLLTGNNTDNLKGTYT